MLDLRQAKLFTNMIYESRSQIHGHSNKNGKLTCDNPEILKNIMENKIHLQPPSLKQKGCCDQYFKIQGKIT